MDVTTHVQLEQSLRDTIQSVAWDISGSPAQLARALDGSFRVRPHIRVMSDAITNLDPQSPNHCNRILIVVPPQSGKSTMVEWGMFWWLINHPDHRMIVASYSTELAMLRSRNVRELVREHGDLFGLRLSRWSSSVSTWDLATGGGIRASSVGAATTGFAADVLVLDDYFRGRAEANSARMRDLVWDWWSAVGKTRLQPGSPVIIPSTAWHPDDLRGRLLDTEGRVEEGGRWRLVHMPAIADPARYGPDPLGRSEGDPLSHPKIRTSDRAALLAHWTERRGDHMTHVPASVTREWQSLYQGDPQPTGESLVSEELLSEIHDAHNAPAVYKPAVAVDPSGGGRDLAGVVGGYLGSDGRLWITHDYSTEGGSEVWSRQVAKLMVELDANIVYVEANYGGDMATRVVRTAWEDLQRQGEVPSGRLMPRIQGVHSRKGKLLRADPVAQQMAMDKVRFHGLRNGHLEKIAYEWRTWRETDTWSPGRIDASVHLAFGLLPMPGGSSSVTSVADRSLRDFGVRRGL